MAQPRHRRIWDAMVTRFGAISVAGGYNTDVRRCVKSPGSVAWLDVPPADRPWIGIISQPREITAEPRRWKIRAKFDLVAVVNASSEGDKNSLIDGLEDDILKAIGVDPRWGTNPDDSEPNAVMTDIEMDQVDDIPDPRQGALIVSLTVTYYREMFA